MKQLGREKAVDQDDFVRNVKAVRAARLSKGLSRVELATQLGWKPVAIEQIENGRCNFSKERLHKVVKAMGYSPEEFENIRRDPKLAVAVAIESGSRDKTVDRRPRRNHYKIVTKEVRVIRVLRQRKEISQTQASRLCGLVPGGFGHIEVGRIELSPTRIEHLVSCLGYSMKDFQNLMAAPVLRDELIAEATQLLAKIPDESLSAAINVLKALGR